MATAETCTLTDRGAYGGDVIRLQVIDDVLDRPDSLLDAEGHLVVLAADVSRHLMDANITLNARHLKEQKVTGRTDLSGRQQVGTVLGADGEGLEGILQLLLFGQLRQDGGDQAGVQPT